ncbi:MAG: cupredoxin domain-containing protein [Candidatus Dormiibacterota bacterium]
MAFSAVVLVAGAWVTIRPGRVAVVILGLVFANVLYWMVPGMASNLANHASLTSVLAPMALAAASALGLVASLVWLTRSNRRRAPSRAATVITVAALVVLLSGTAFAAANGSTATPRGSGDLAISAKNAKFSTSTLSAPAGTVTVDFTNEDLFWHTVTIDQLGVDIRVPVKSQRAATFNAPAGTYSYRCAIPGHESIGMKGTLTVR